MPRRVSPNIGRCELCDHNHRTAYGYLECPACSCRGSRYRVCSYAHDHLLDDSSYDDCEAAAHLERTRAAALRRPIHRGFGI
jgi:hypothetical protein